MNLVRSICIVTCLAIPLSLEVLKGAQNSSTTSLQFVTGPSDGQRLAMAAAKNIPNAGPRDDLKARPPLPLYTVESDALAAGKGLQASRACGFLYLIESSDGTFVGTADVQVDAECAPRLSTLRTRAFGIGARQALLALAGNDQVKRGSFEPRVIYADLDYEGLSPAGFVAVWLKSLQKGNDLIYPLQSPMIRPGFLYTANDVLKRLRPLLSNVQWSSDYDLHAYYVDRFLASEGNGISRVLQWPMSIRESMRLRTTSRDTYRLESFDLIGIGKHPNPVAFLGRDHQTVATLRQTRPLTAFEKKAVAELSAGEDVAIWTGKSERVVVGALRAQKDCLTCHGAKMGDLLGALSYRLTPAQPVNAVVARNVQSR
jgi:hypothetical protein